MHIGKYIFYFSAKFNAGVQVFFQVTPPDESYLAELLGEKPNVIDVNASEKELQAADDAAVASGSRAQSRASNKVLPVVDEHELTPVSAS